MRYSDRLHPHADQMRNPLNQALSHQDMLNALHISLAVNFFDPVAQNYFSSCIKWIIGQNPNGLFKLDQDQNGCISLQQIGKTLIATLPQA